MFKPEDVLPWVSAGMILFILIRQEKTMATKADLDAAVSTLTADDAAVLSAVSTSGTAIGTALKNLLDKINANPTAPASDFSDEVAALAQDHTDFQTAIASLNTISQTATGDDPGPQTGTDQ